ncbi:MAG: hypothetical protein KAI71_05250 [Candidatus Pacebacteria bacterium]|nr:hypothetical protein [Candidatus Paceibacterota bacterium]
MKKLKKIKIKFDKKIINKIFSKFIKYKSLIILFYFFAIILFSFKVVYEDAYVKIKYIDYIESEDKVIANLKSANRLSLKMIEQINVDKLNFKNKEQYDYKNPFVFNESEKDDAESDIVSEEDPVEIDDDIIISDVDVDVDVIDVDIGP